MPPGAQGHGEWTWILRARIRPYAAAPLWSHLTHEALFTMTNVGKSGRLGSGTAHLYTLPYSKAGTTGGHAGCGRRLATSRAQYYGTVGRRQADRLQRAGRNHRGAPASQARLDGHGDSDGMYAQPATEIYVIIANGGKKSAAPGQRSLPRAPACRPLPASTTAGPSGRRRSRPRAAARTTGSSSRRGARASNTRRAADRAAVSDGGDDRRDRRRSRTIPPSTSGTSLTTRTTTRRPGISSRFPT